MSWFRDWRHIEWVGYRPHKTEDDAMSEPAQPTDDPGHLLPPDEWARVQADAARYADTPPED